jgi:hypothetical protein
MLEGWLSLFQCNHSRANALEGKTFCPDCGAGIVYRWVVLQCVLCQQRRAAHYQGRNIKPCQECCIQCGHSQTQALYLDNPQVYQLQHALLQPLIIDPKVSPWQQLRITLQDSFRPNLEPTSPVCFLVGS